MDRTRARARTLQTPAPRPLRPPRPPSDAGVQAWTVAGRLGPAVLERLRAGPADAVDVAGALGVAPAVALRVLRRLWDDGRVALVDRRGWIFRCP